MALAPRATCEVHLRHAPRDSRDVQFLLVCRLRYRRLAQFILDIIRLCPTRRVASTAPRIDHTYCGYIFKITRNINILIARMLNYPAEHDQRAFNYAIKVKFNIFYD